MSRSFYAVVVSVCLAGLAAAQQPFEFLPGAKYEPAVPTPQQVLGYALGEEISLHGEVTAYLRELARNNPRARLVEYGKSCEGRALHYLVLGSEANLARLDAIKSGMQKLADPRRLAPGEGEQLVGQLPAVAWLAYTVHGDEASGSDAALMTAYHLLAAKDDALVQTILQECVVVIDPLENPDGRDRFVHSTRAARGRWPAADPVSAEHSQPWPGGRSNHELFDMNRDWFSQSQPETRARVRTFQEWWPLVYVDLHEMGGNSTYYFAPPGLPINPEVTDTQRQWLTRYGRNDAAWFDRFGFDYFTREEFDSFYPGYGDCWPTFHGSIGMTYEMASSRGLLYRRKDDSLLAYRQCVRQHFLASLATLETIARGRREALAAFLTYRQTAIEEGQKGPVREYVFPARGDRTRLGRLVELLLAQGIEVRQATGELKNGKVKPLSGGDSKEQSFPSGSFVVSLAQPAKRLASVLLAPHFEMDRSFLDEQKRREKRRLDLEFYDLTGWSLPLLFDVETWVAESESVGSTQLLAVGAGKAMGSAPANPPKVAYVVAWGQNGAAALLAELLQAGVKARCIDKAFKLNGLDFPAGSFVVKVVDQPADLHARMLAGAVAHGVPVHGTDTSWVESGVNFGSNHSLMLRTPKVALAWDRPTDANSAGWARHQLEQRYGIPTTPIRTSDLGRADLEKYTVLVLPDGGNYGAVLGKGGAEAIERWVARGGVLVTLGSASRWLTEEPVKLLASAAEDRKQPGNKKDAKKDAGKPSPKDGDKPAVETPPAEKADDKNDDKKDDKTQKDDEPFDYEKAIQPDKEKPATTPGAILRVATDPDHWLAFGYRGTANVVSQSSDIFTPVKMDRGTNVAVYAPEAQLLLSGFMFDATRKQLAQKAYLVHQPHGKGHVIAFAEDPNVRAVADGLDLMFLDAVLLTAGR